ncbi:carbohydrate ABC transporter permease [Ktedonosporobacter rubrisoli]|uniref:Carbohydrate ABC transporter permease n=1 Tax=Ktedonosporobacter rubrisoli TaxID=2509675 RepID=A0A4P6JZL9_KTERU|nr:carbohydrate ABC transporter permease [Ktedonosporobacter rubrisoli]QBD80566.1 carbohydrate ABC transporter permease [Ktedonosporobacter rubrisoli]
MQSKRSLLKSSLPIHILLILGACIFVVPFLWMLLTSVKTLGEATQVPPVIFPASLQWGNYSEVLATLPFLKFYENTILMTIGRTLGQLLFCSLAAYAFARIEFPGRNFLFMLMLSVLMVPTYVFLLPQYLIMKDLGWLNSLQALIVPGLFSAFGTFLLRQFFMGIPRELDEAAQIDGANHLVIYWRVILPLAKPALIALAIFTILWSWNDLMWPLVVNSANDMLTLSVGLSLLQGEHVQNFQVVMAGAVLATWPMLVMFILLQRYFIEGIAITGTKG